MNNEERAKSLTISLLHKSAELAVATEEEQVNRLQEQLEELSFELSAITDTDPNALLMPIIELAEEKRREIDAGIAEEVAIALIVAQARAEKQFQKSMERNKENARERAAEACGGEALDLEGEESEEEGDDADRKVDPDVLEGLATEVVQN